MAAIRLQLANSWTGWINKQQNKLTYFCLNFKNMVNIKIHGYSRTVCAWNKLHTFDIVVNGKFHRWFWYTNGGYRDEIFKKEKRDIYLHEL